MPATKQFSEQDALTKARDIFWAQGYNATSMQDLVGGLGISRSSLYDTFGDKKKLFDRVFGDYCTMGAHNVAALLEAETPVKETLHNFIEDQILRSATDTDRKGCFTVNAANELAGSDPEILAILTAHRKRIQKTFRRLLEKGIDSGELSKNLDAKSVAAMLFALYSGLQTVSKMSPTKKEIRAILRSALSILD